MSIVEAVARYLCCDKDTLLKMAKRSCSHYKKYSIPKKTSGYRVIYHPSKEAKALQYALSETTLKQFSVHSSAMAYRRGLKSPLLTNAKSHAHLKYTIRLDFIDFFPSIKPEDLFVCFTRELEKEEKELLSKILFMKQGPIMKLVIGAPSSPLVSNIIMQPLDSAIFELSKNVSSESAYTRYADDIFFSTNKRGKCNEFYKKLVDLLRNTKYPRVMVNSLKTFYSSRGKKRKITGLVVTPEGGISIGKKRKEELKKKIYAYKKGLLEKKEVCSLRGYLAYVADVEPQFINNLAMKYSAETISGLFKRSSK